MKKFTISLLFLFMSFNLVAEDNSAIVKGMFDKCGELSSYKQIYGCYEKAYKKTDTFLNSEYKNLIKDLNDSNKENLIDTQRKWLKFRDADCLFSEPRKEDYSIASANRAACLAKNTNRRLEQLEKYSWDKGCNGCPW